MKRVKGIVSAGLALVCVGGMAACGGEKNIMVISRDAESGTKAAFEEIVKKDGTKLQDAELISELELASSTGIVKSKVETNKTAIGYISFSSLDESVKALQINGVDPTVENVQNGTYELKRPFILMTPNGNAEEKYGLNDVALDFFQYCMSETSKSAVASLGCIEADREYVTYETATNTVSGTIYVEGSTSMTELMTAIIGEYKKVQPGVTVTPTYNGSSNGRTAVAANTIGLASSSKESDAYTQHTLCIDAIAVIVHKDNALDNVTVEQLYDIYTGAITKFSEITK